MAKDQGFFAKHGIDLELVVGAGSSAAQLPALSTGELDFMLASPVTPLTASTQGLDIRIVSGVTQNDPATVEDSTAVVVGAGSPIQRARDLSGKKVSVNALGGIGEIGIREAVALDGGDPQSITFVQLSFPEVAAQLASGQIDAGMTGSPFLQQILAKGGRVVSDFINATGARPQRTCDNRQREARERQPRPGEAVRRPAMDEALPFLNTHKDLIRAAMPAALGTDPAVAAKTTLSIYDPSIDVKTIQLFGDLLYKYKVVDKRPDAAAVVWQP